MKYLPTLTRHLRLTDPRHYQIAALSLLLIYGCFGLDFGLTPFRVLLIMSAALFTQYFLTRWKRLPVFDPRSPLISGLSLCLLLRTNLELLAVLAAVITIASKFLLRRDGKHIFNPTNIGLVVMMLLTPQVWVSPGQWGSIAFFGFLLICVGGLVIHRAERSDVTYAFVAFYLAIVFGRALWFGDPLSIAWHQMQSGGFLIFAFFMISDPKTTPDSRAGRILFALLVAVSASVFRFSFFDSNGLLWALAIFAITVPIIDWIIPGQRYEWTTRTVTQSPTGGVSNEVVAFNECGSESDRAGHYPQRIGLLRLLRR